MKKEEIKIVYEELQGYLSQIPLHEIQSCIIDSASWDQINQSIDELNQLSGKNYDRFKILPTEGTSESFVRTITFRQKIGGLISRLHAEFFSDESKPFSGGPSTIISQNQNVQQEVKIEIINEIKDKIIEKIGKYSEGSKERTFLEKLKDNIKGVSNINGLILLVLKLANSVGLTVDKIRQIFE